MRFNFSYVTVGCGILGGSVGGFMAAQTYDVRHSFDYPIVFGVFGGTFVGSGKPIMIRSALNCVKNYNHLSSMAKLFDFFNNIA